MLSELIWQTDEMNDKNNNYQPVKGSPDSPRRQTRPKPQNSDKKKKKKRSKVFMIFKKLLTVIMTTLLSLFLIMIITGTIVCTALTVYVLDFMEETTGVTLQELESGSNTYFYATRMNEETGQNEYVMLHSVQTDVQRIPITIDDIPQHVRDAFVYTEDERFYTHDGVDYKRTFTAFLNMFLHIYDTEQGGSTITQQLIKNLTGDEEHSPQRKIREIFRAMQLEKTYSKDEILEEYLNYIGFGGPTNGIQLAATRYFGKDVKDLTTAEAAALAAIPKSPTEYGPLVDTYGAQSPEDIAIIRSNNKERQQYVLWQLYDNGAITYDEYQQYLDEKMVFTDSEEYLAAHPENAAQELEDKQKVYSWVVDAMYNEACGYLMELYNITYSEALKRINNGGYMIYSTVDLDMQEYMENRFLDVNNLSSMDLQKNIDLDGDGDTDESQLHIAFEALNYDGSVRATVGNIGEKVDSLITSYANTEQRQIGSTMKPISTYGLALDTDTIHWGSYYRDVSIMEVNGQPWPTNYSTDGHYSVSGASIPIYLALQKSYNTIPAQLCQALTPAEVYKFCTEKMGMQLAEEAYDGTYSPLTVGSLTYGITLENLVNAYIPYGNNGIQCDAHIISKIEQGNHEVIYENNGNPREAVSGETAWVMNRLLKNVVENGTGTAAKLQNKVVCGKTGTTDDWYDLTFVGLTRDFVSGITIGYKSYNESLKLPSSLKSAQIWYNAVGEYADSISSTPADFEPNEKVISAPMCTVSGKIAGASCPKGITGYWKSTNAPTCDGCYSAPVETPDDTPANEEPAETSASEQPATQAAENPQTPTAAPVETAPPAETPQPTQAPEQPVEPEVPETPQPEQPAEPAPEGGEPAPAA